MSFAAAATIGLVGLAMAVIGIVVVEVRARKDVARLEALLAVLRGTRRGEETNGSTTARR